MAKTAMKIKQQRKQKFAVREYACISEKIRNLQNLLP